MTSNELILNPILPIFYHKYINTQIYYYINILFNYYIYRRFYLGYNLAMGWIANWFLTSPQKRGEAK
jgi:hypothetical protein